MPMATTDRTRATKLIIIGQLEELFDWSSITLVGLNVAVAKSLITRVTEYGLGAL